MSYFETGKKNVRRSYARLPMPNSIIEKVEKMADRNRAVNGIKIKNRQN